MPELPEVETVRIGLLQLLPRHTITAVSSDWPKSFPNAPVDVEAYLVGAKVLDVRRRAKVLMIDLDTNYSLVIHLKMTGQLVYVRSSEQKMVDSRLKVAKKPTTNSQLLTPNHKVRFGAGHPNSSLIGELPDKSTRVILDLDNNARLFFNDQRKFGWVRLLPTVQIPQIDFFKKLGPEPLEASFSATDFIDRLMRRKKSNIKAVLLDQTILAGVGNIYADESLFAAKIHPESVTGKIPKERLIDLFRELQAVLKLSIEKGGSSDRNYVNAEGKKGSYIDFAKVFRREKQPCLICGEAILKTKVAGRGTHTCYKCQKRYI